MFVEEIADKRINEPDDGNYSRDAGDPASPNLNLIVLVGLGRREMSPGAAGRINKRATENARAGFAQFLQRLLGLSLNFVGVVRRGGSHKKG